MAEMQAVDLKGHVPGDATIEFLRAELPPEEYGLPFALIRYSLQGKEQDFGLRLDLDKQVFLDHLEDGDEEETIKKAAPRIVEFLNKQLCG